MIHACKANNSRNQVPAVDYFYSAAKRRLRGALWPSFALALIPGSLSRDLADLRITLLIIGVIVFIGVNILQFAGQ